MPTCPYAGLVALHASAGLVQAEHADAVGLSTLQVAQVTVGHRVVALGPVCPVCSNADCNVRERAAGLLPGHRSRVRVAAEGGADVRGLARDWQRGETQKTQKVENLREEEKKSTHKL